jgi:Tol biopolymer transport system component
MPKFDGHPSISPDRKFVITDSYPDKSRFSSLYLYSIDKDNITKLGSFYQPFEYTGEKRVDLHPKWGKNKNIYFESSHSGKRALYKMKIHENEE